MVQSWANMLPETEQRALFIVGGFGLATHFIFNRWEPYQIPTVTFLLVVVPLTLSTLLLPFKNIASALSVGFLTYHVTLISSILAYRLGPWHPLARYPGPIWLKVSMFGQMYLSIKTTRHRYIQSLHIYYQSDVVRIGPNEISICDASVIAPILGTTGLSKGTGSDGRALHQQHRALLTWTDSAAHAKRRRPWNRAMNTSALKDYEPALMRRVAQFGDLLAKVGEGGAAFDLVHYMSCFLYDFMGDMAFSGGNETMRDGDTLQVFRTMHDGLRSSMVLDAIPWWARHTHLISGGSHKFQKLRMASMERVKKRIAEGSTIKDIFYYINNEDGADPVSPTLEAVAREGILAIFAGSGTTAHTLCNVMYCLIKHPEAYRRLQEEVDRFYPAGEDTLNTTYHGGMPFLEAVIFETLRLYPVQPSGSQRNTRERDMTVGPHYIPPHTNVRVHTYSIQRDPRCFFPFPETFFPDRWIIAEDPSAKSSLLPPSAEFAHAPHAFFPFSFGPTNCVGKGMAMKEMKVALCYLTQRFEMEFAEGFNVDTWDDGIKDWIAVEMGELPVVIRERVKA